MILDYVLMLWACLVAEEVQEEDTTPREPPNTNAREPPMHKWFCYLKTDHIDFRLRIARKMRAEKLTPGIQRVNQKRASWTFKTSQVSTHPRLRATLESAGSWAEPRELCDRWSAQPFRQNRRWAKEGGKELMSELAHHCTPWHTMILASTNLRWFHHQHYRMVPPSYKLVYKPITVTIVIYIYIYIYLP